MRDPDGEEAGAALRELLGDLASKADLAAVIAERQRVFDDVYRPRATDLMRQALRAGELAEDDRVSWREGVPGRLERRNGRTVLVGEGREVDFPAAATRTLEVLIAADPQSAGRLDDGLDWESRRVVLETLVREGFLAVQRPEDG